MTYVDAFHLRIKEDENSNQKSEDKILVVERIKGERVLREIPPDYVFYYAHEKGSHKSIYGDKCERFATPSFKKFQGELKRRKVDAKIFESDIKPVFRMLARDYKNAEPPVLNLGFFDIEADFHPEKGFAPSDNPFNAITSITLYVSHLQTNYTLALCPPTLTIEAAKAFGDNFDNTYIFDDEREMLLVFLALIEPVDVLTGWNSAAYDIPYLINRIEMLLGKEATTALCLWDQPPRAREMRDKFGRIVKSYDLVGRVHLDYMDLYKKHNPQQQQSYTLNAIGESEVGESKTQYAGTLDELYKKDFRLFIEYNRQDVMLLVKIDQKRKFIELANQIAHANCVPLPTTMGTVALIEQAIINDMHEMGRVVHDRKPKEFNKNPAAEAERSSVVGAYVADPKVGLHEHIGCVDLNALYPSAIMACNMSPETLFGQIRLTETMALIQKRIDSGIDRALAWEGIFCALELDHIHAKDDTLLTIDFEDGKVAQLSAADVHDLIFSPSSNLCITANCTLFRTDVDGMIPALLKKWNADRRALQGKMKEWAAIQKLGDAWTAPTPEDAAKTPAEWITFYDQRQQAAKIRNNGLYGALLQSSCRFFDERVGQSTTLTGRSIAKHMNGTINEITTGVHDYKGDAIIYADTDSSYFSAYQVLKDRPDYADFDWTRENIIALYDGIADATNETFVNFMARTFNTSPERGANIKAGRELIASTGLFIKKKKYAVLMYDKEGTRLDVGKDGTPSPGKLKAMGLDLKRSDTPKFMQKFLESLLMDILTGADKAKMFSDIKAFRAAFVGRPGWEKGMPKKVSNLSGPEQLKKAANKVGMFDTAKGRVNMPGHVTASLNWNTLCDLNHDQHATRIMDGARIIVCKLKSNAMHIDSIAYPVDEPHLPKWFRDLPFDHAAMEEKIIDGKLENLVGTRSTGLCWDLRDTKDNDELFQFN